MDCQSGLRKRIEEIIGKKILENYCKNGDGTSGPTMMPPIPTSTFIDKLPKGVLDGVNVIKKKQQDSYAAEVMLFRCFEEVKDNCVVIHQLEYTHEQCAAFLQNHKCNKESCKPRKTEGECDFIVIGDNFVAVFEVKGLSLQGDGTVDEVKLEGCCDSARTQRKRMVDLIKSINPSVTTYDFTVFPNLLVEQVNECYLVDDTIMFSDELEKLIVDSCKSFSSQASSDDKSAMDKLCCCLLGLWCIQKDSTYELTDGSLAKCITDIDRKLRGALVTRRAVDEENSKKKGKNSKKKGKAKKYPENLEMVPAPNIFKRHLEISCLTKDQLDVFNSEEQFLWVEGPAGSGKTIAMLGKIIHLALTTSDKRILLISPTDEKYPASKRYLEVLSNISNIRQDVTCKSITYDYEGDISDQLQKASTLLSQQLAGITSKIVLLNIKRSLTHNVYSLINQFDYIFCDDVQRLFQKTIYNSRAQQKPRYDKTIISEGLLPIVKNSSTNKTSMWILFDAAQLPYEWRFLDRSLTLDSFNELKSFFVGNKYKELTVNLRNTFEISFLLSIIRKHCERMYSFGTLPVKWPEQEEGHVLRGTKAVIYLLSDDKWEDVLKEELEVLKGPDSSLENKDIAVLYRDTTTIKRANLRTTIRSVLKKWDALDDKITVHNAVACVSAEWPAVISINRHRSYTFTLPDNKEKITYSYTLGCLYRAISRARVYSTAIVFNYKPNICEYTDKLLDELRERRDVCRIVEY